MSDAKERGDEAEIERLREEQMEAFGDQANMLKEQFRPMVWIMLLTIPVFLWMYWKLGSGRVPTEELQMTLPLMGEANLKSGRALVFPVWIIWYMLCSFSFSNVIRKALNIQTTPTWNTHSLQPTFSSARAPLARSLAKTWESTPPSVPPSEQALTCSRSPWAHENSGPSVVGPSAHVVRAR